MSERMTDGATATQHLFVRTNIREEEWASVSSKAIAMELRPVWSARYF